MEEKQIKHYKRLILNNLNRNLPKKVVYPNIKETISNIIKRVEFYMVNYTNNFEPEKYNISVDKLPNGMIFINVVFIRGDISRRLIFLDNGELFGVKHFDKKKPHSFTYGLMDKSVAKINYETDPMFSSKHI